MCQIDTTYNYVVYICISIKTKAMKLSAYTIAENCSDTTDCQAGIDELKQYFEQQHKAGKKPCDTAYIRFSKLHEKLKRYSK